jgi:predicted small secreted protein
MMAVRVSLGFIPQINSKINNIRRLIMIKKTVSSLLAMLFVAGSLATLVGCNTMEGVGKDIEKGGSEIKEEAAEHK